MNYSETAMNLKIFTQGKNKKANKSGWNLTIFSSDSTKKTSLSPLLQKVKRTEANIPRRETEKI